MAQTVMDRFNDKSFNKINMSKEIIKYELEMNTKLIIKNFSD